MDWIVPLLLPSLVSAIAVFIVSSILHMLLPWHRSDYKSVPNESGVLDVLSGFNIPPGDYMLPRPASRAEMSSPEFVERMKRGPNIVMSVMPPWNGSIVRNLGLWFAYCFVVSFFAGHVAQGADVMTHRDHLVHTVGLASMMGYTLGLWQMWVWYRRSGITTLKATIDGVIYGIITACIFAWFWT